MALKTHKTGNALQVHGMCQCRVCEMCWIQSCQVLTKIEQGEEVLKEKMHAPQQEMLTKNPPDL